MEAYIFVTLKIYMIKTLDEVYASASDTPRNTTKKSKRRNLDS